MSLGLLSFGDLGSQRRGRGARGCLHAGRMPTAWRLDALASVRPRLCVGKRSATELPPRAPFWYRIESKSVLGANAQPRSNAVQHGGILALSRASRRECALNVSNEILHAHVDFDARQAAPGEGAGASGPHKGPPRPGAPKRSKTLSPPVLAERARRRPWFDGNLRWRKLGANGRNSASIPVFFPRALGVAASTRPTEDRGPLRLRATPRARASAGATPFVLLIHGH